MYTMSNKVYVNPSDRYWSGCSYQPWNIMHLQTCAVHTKYWRGVTIFETRLWFAHMIFLQFSYNWGEYAIGLVVCRCGVMVYLFTRYCKQQYISSEFPEKFHDYVILDRILVVLYKIRLGIYTCETCHLIADKLRCFVRRDAIKREQYTN